MIASALSSCANFCDTSRRLLGIAAAVELDQLDLLAADAALGVDLVDGDVHRRHRGLADGLEDAGHHGVEPDDDLLRG